MEQVGASMEQVGGASKEVVPADLTSDVFGAENPPKDWCDISLLIPHEALRREMSAMERSIEALKADYDDEKDYWRSLYFAEWFVDFMAPIIHSHHENEEGIYFPWIATKAEIPEKKMAKDHKALIELLDAIEKFCQAIIDKQGKKCGDEINKLKATVPPFYAEMKGHLKEEEEIVPALLRGNFTAEDEKKILQKIGKREGVSGMRSFFPSVFFAMREWATPSFQEELMASLPGSFQTLIKGYFIPDYENCVIPKRDAPTLDSMPTLSKVKCCKIPFCCACIF
jgi:hemerythrin-like domain-containing protein